MVSADRRWYGGVLVGFVLGLAAAWVWPHEPVKAAATDRTSQFALVTAPVSVLEGLDGVFILDFLTGELRGGVINTTSAEFTNFYARNVARDFGVNPAKGEPKYAIMAGVGQLQGSGALQPAASLIYVAEFNSGKIIPYGFTYRVSQRPLPPTEMTMGRPMQFRAPIE